MSYQDCQRIERNGGLTCLREGYKLTPAQLTVIRFLIQADRDGRCFPTQETIAFETGLPVETVRRATRALAAQGLITREKMPYVDKRGRARPGKIHHYRFSEEVIEAIVYGRPLPDTVQNDRNREILPDTAQNEHNREPDLPGTAQNDHNREPDLPDTMQNDRNREPDLPDSVQNDRNRETLPDTDQNDRYIPIKMNGSSDHSDQYIPCKMISEKLEVEVEKNEKIEDDGKRHGETANPNVNGAGFQSAGPDAEEPQPRPAGRDRFNRLVRVLTAAQSNYLVRGLQAILDRETERSVKEEIVHRCCDRIEELLLRGQEPTAALAGEPPPDRERPEQAAPRAGLHAIAFLAPGREMGYASNGGGDTMLGYAG